MSIGATFTQLVLFDDINIKDQEWSVKVKYLSEILSSCEFWIFCNEEDSEIEKSLEPVKNSRIRLHKSSDPVIQMFDTLYDKRFTYSFILVVCDKDACYARNLNKITKKHEHISVMPMDPYNVNVQDIIRKVDFQKIKELESNPVRSAPTLSLNDTSRQHSGNKHDSDHLKKTSNNKNSRLGDQYENELYCLVCGKSFHTKDAQNKHIKAGHPDATLDDDDDYE
jgi:hypothetical protein